MTKQTQYPQRAQPFAANAAICREQAPSSSALHPLAWAILLAFAGSALALPSDPLLVAGQATVSRSGPAALLVNQSSAKAALDWRSFNVAANESVRFNQPSASALTVNRVTGNDPSQILGQISAPGSVFLINPAGVYFGASAVVHVGNLIAGTLSANPRELLDGRLSFSSAPGAVAVVRNDGRIETPVGGSVSLLGTQVINAGSISTPAGTTGLIAGERIVVDFHGDGLVRYQVDAAAARALVHHQGRIEADGGRVALQASAREALVDTVLNVDGIVRARGARLRNGEIFLDAGASGVLSVSGQLDAAGAEPGASGGQVSVLGEKVGLFAGARIDASGDAGGGRVLVGGDYQGQGGQRNARQTYVGPDVRIVADALVSGDGGRAIVWADDWTRFSGAISARGGERRGDGGFVEVSGKNRLHFDGRVDTSAAHGRGGSLLLDPSDLYVGGAQQPGETSLTVNPFVALDPADPAALAGYFVSTASFSSDTRYTLQASRNIYLRENVSFGTSGTGSPPSSVTITAGNQIDAGGFRLATAGGALTLSAAAVVAPGVVDLAGGTLTINLSSPDGSLIQGSPLHTASLVKEGPGRLAFSASNLLLSGGPNGSDLTVNGGTVDLNATTQSIGRLLGTGSVALAGGSLSVNVPAGPLATFGGRIAGAGTLSKSGAGRLLLSGADSVLGGTTIDAGTLEISGANGATGATQINGGTLKVSGAGSLGAGSVVTLASGVGAEVDISAASQNQEIAGLSGGAASGAPSSVGKVVLGERTLTVRVPEGSALDFAGTISGGSNGSLSKDGAGTLRLQGANTYRGTTRVSDGILALTRSDALHANSALVVDGGALELAGAFTLNTLAGGFSLRGDGAGLGALRLAAAGSAAYFGAITLSGSTRIGVSSGGTLELGGAIAQDVGAAAYVLSKTGTGRLKLSGPTKDYRGGTELIEGSLLTAAADVLPSDGRLSLTGAAALLDLDGKRQHVGTLSGVPGAQVNLGTSGWLYVNQADDAVFAGTLAGSGGNLSKLGNGRLTLTQANTYGGTTTVSQGVLALTQANSLDAQSRLVVAGGSVDLAGSFTLNTLNGGLSLAGNGYPGRGALTVGLGPGGAPHQAAYDGPVTLQANASLGGDGSADTLTLRGDLSASPSNAGYKLTKLGPATLVLAGAASNFRGGSVVDAGIVRVASARALGSGSAEVKPGASLQIDDVTLLLSGATSKLTLAGSGPDGAGALRASGAAAYHGALVLGADTQIGVAAADATLSLNGGIASTPYGLRKLGDGTLLLGGQAKGYAGGTVVAQGMLSVADWRSLGVGGTVEVLAGAVLQLDNVALAASRNPQIQIAGQGASGSGALIGRANASYDGRVVLATDAGIGVPEANHRLTLSGAIDQLAGGDRALSKLGAGRLRLAGPQKTYQGGTFIVDGTLETGADDVLPAQRALTLSTGSAVLDLQGRDQSIGTLTASEPAARIWLNGGTLTVDQEAPTTFAGQIGENSQVSPLTQGRLVKAGTGQLTLTGDNRYAGGTHLAAGVLSAAHGHALGSGAVNVAAGATLDIHDVTLALAPTAELRLAGVGAGGTVLAAGALTGSGTHAAYHGPLFLASDARINVPQADDTLTLKGAIAGAPAAALSKVGAGQLFVEARGSYTGRTIIEQGVLIAQTSDRVLGSGAVEVKTGGTLRVNDILLGNEVSLLGGSLLVNGAAIIDGALNLAQSTTLSVPTDASLEIRRTLLGGGDDQSLTIDGGGTLKLFGGARNLGSLTLQAVSTLDLGSAQTVSTVGGQTYLGIVRADSATLTSRSGSGAMSLDNAANQLRGSFSVSGGTTHLTTASPALSVALVAGATQVQATNGSLVLSGTADSLRASSTDTLVSSVATLGDSELTAVAAASNRGAIGGDLTIDAGGAIGSSGNVAGQARLLSRGGGAITHAAAVGQRLSSDTTGDTTLAGSLGELQVERTAQLVFGPGTTHIQNAARIELATGAVSQAAALTVGGPLSLRAPGQNVQLADRENDFAHLDITAATTRVVDRNTLAVQMQTGDTHLQVLAGSLELAGSASNLVVASAGPVSQSAPLNVTGVVTISAPGQSVLLDLPANDFGRVDISAGTTRIVDRDTLAAQLQSGETTIDLLAGDLQLAGSAARLIANSVGGALTSLTAVLAGDAVLTSGAGGAISHAGSVRGRLSTDTTGNTTLAGDFGSLLVRRSAQLSFGPGPTRIEDSAEIVGVGGAISQTAALSVAGGPLTIRAVGQNVELDHRENDFQRIEIAAGTTSITDRNGFQATLQTGNTTLRALTGALDLAGVASTLVARSEGSAGDLTSRVATTGDTTLSTGGGAIVHAADVGGRLTTSTPGQTTIAGTLDALSVVHSGGMIFGRTVVNKEATISVAGPLTQTAGLQVGQATTIDAAGYSVALGSADNRFVGGLRLIAGESEVRTGGALTVLLDTGSTQLAAERLQLAGRMRVQPALRSRLISATTVELGQLSLEGAGVVDLVANQAEMPAFPVPKVSVQDASGRPAPLAVYGSSIYQTAGSVLQSAPEVSLNLVARRASIDLTAGASAASVLAGQEPLGKSGPGGLIEVYASPQERLAPVHPNGLTNRLQGPLSAVSEVDATQSSNRKSVVAIASDSLSIATRPVPALDADTVLLLARTIHGGGGKIQTHVGASQLRDGRNIATDPEQRDDNAFSILPSIFVIADVNATPPVGSPRGFYFGDLGSPISLSFGAVGGVANNSSLQTIAADPFKQDASSGDVPIYFATTAPGGVDPAGVVARRLVYPSSLAPTAVRQVIIDGFRIEDTSAYGAVQSGLAEVLNQVRREQLESGYSNENVAAQLRKGVITETRVGQAAVNRFQGVSGVPSCVGLAIDEQLACAQPPGGSQP